MKFLEQILGELGADTLKSVTFIPHGCCYLKSVKSVLDLTPEKIVLLIGGGRISVEGEALEVGEYFGGDLLIRGDVRGIKVE